MGEEPSKLAERLNQSGLLTNSPITPRDLARIRAYAQEYGMELPSTITIAPLNTPAALIHCKVVTLALDLLSPLKQQEFKALYSPGSASIGVRDRATPSRIPTATVSCPPASPPPTAARDEE